MKLTAVVSLSLLVVGCDSGGSSEEEENGTDEPTLQVVREQTFDAGTAGWIDRETSGQPGWCGTIEQVDDAGGSVTPSDGEGYAVVEHGACNMYWQDLGFLASGPYSLVQYEFDAWPEGGFRSELDIYLDPAWEAGTGFDYAVDLLNQRGGHLGTALFGFYFFHVAVDSSAGALLVAASDRSLYQRNQSEFTPRQDLETLDHIEVTDADWYTLRHVFRDETNRVVTDLELVRGNQVLFTTTIDAGGQAFEIIEVGGFHEAWFPFLSQGLRLPIDEFELLHLK